MADQLQYRKPPPPPIHSPSNLLNDLIEFGELDLYMLLAMSTLLGLLLVWHIAQAFVKRLWLLPSHPSRVLALNAATLALLGIVAKPPKPGKDTSSLDMTEYYLLVCAVLICSALGAFMPSIAASSDLKDMWSNVVGVGLLILSTNFIIFLQLYYVPEDSYNHEPVIHETRMEHKVVMASLFLLLLVLLMQAMALEEMMSDRNTIVSQRLDQLCMEAKPGYKADVILERRACSWETIEHNTRIKLMMVLTSSPENVLARSPCTAIVGALVLLCVIVSLKNEGVLWYYAYFQGHSTVVCGFICVWRWVRVALQEDRPFLSLVFATEPSYWCRKVSNFRHKLRAGPRIAQPNVFKEGQWGFREVLWNTTTFLMLCCVVPLYRLLVALTRFTHILSALFVQKLIWLPIRALGCDNVFYLCKKPFQKTCPVFDAVAESATISLDSLGVVCLEGEDARIVRREFAGAANRITRRRQFKKLEKNKSDLKALVSHLQSFEDSKFTAGKSNSILDALHEDGTPFVEKLHVEHGFQFGWSLTAISLVALLAKIEVKALGKSTVSEAATNAYWQAMDMMQLVDEQFVPCIVCSKETYGNACASAWSKVQKKKCRWTHKRNQANQEVQLNAIDQILKAMLGKIIEEFNKANKPTHDNIAAAWSQQAVESYTMHTLCKNLLRCWTDIEAAVVADGGGGGEENNTSRKIIEGMVGHINALIVEVLACCLSNLPTAVDMSTTEAVRQGKMGEIEKALVLIAQGKYVWKELQWPTLHSTRQNGLGQLRQWMY